MTTPRMLFFSTASTTSACCPAQLMQRHWRWLHYQDESWRGAVWMGRRGGGGGGGGDGGRRWSSLYWSSPARQRRTTTTTTTTATSPAYASTHSSSSSPAPKPADTPSAPPSPSDTAHLPPHRRRQAQRQQPLVLPINASSTLTTLSASQSRPILRHLSSFLSLSKPRLSALVVLSAMAPYALYPVPAFLATATAITPPSLSPQTLLFLTVGTALCSASANALNMLYEPRTDALMSRTRNRPLVRDIITPRAALLFAVAAAVLGTAALRYGVNPTVAFLGAANIVLYAAAYTPLKALTPWNTWVGALVGAIPPLMGWAAAAGDSATADGSFLELLFAPDGSSLGGWLFAGLLFAWQFPHFMALAWPVAGEYRAAGLRMLAWTDPKRNARVALRYSLAFVPICVGLCLAGVTEWSFAATSLPVNVWLAWKAVGFWKHTGAAGSARGLFWASVWHLPAVMVLALVQKKGMWRRVWTAIMGEGEGDHTEGVWGDVGE